MRRLILINGAAGRGAALRVWRRLAPLATGVEVAIPATPAESRAVVRQAVQAGYERVVAVGGDGTLNAIAGELAGSPTMLGIVPAGTGNDLARNLRLPSRPEAALALALAAPGRAIDLGVLTAGPDGQGRCFLNVAGCGFDAEVAARAGALPRAMGGTVPYLLGALDTLRWFRPRLVELQVDGRRYSRVSTMVAVANGAYYAGGMQIAPGARLDDGLLDVIVAGALTRLELLYLLAQVYRGGHLAHPKVTRLRGEEVRLAMEPAARLHMDGEPLGHGSLAMRLWRGALHVAAPPAVPAAQGARPIGLGRGL